MANREPAALRCCYRATVASWPARARKIRLCSSRQEASVARSLVITRPAGPEDIPTLLRLWDELRQVGGRAERAVNPVVTAVDVRER